MTKKTKTRWTTAEDTTLTGLVQKSGNLKDAFKLAVKETGRSPVSVKKRWGDLEAKKGHGNTAAIEGKAGDKATGEQPVKRRQDEVLEAMIKLSAKLQPGSRAILVDSLFP